MIKNKLFKHIDKFNYSCIPYTVLVEPDDLCLLIDNMFEYKFYIFLHLKTNKSFTISNAGVYTCMKLVK